MQDPSIRNKYLSNIRKIQISVFFFTFPIRDPEFEIAKSVDLSSGGAHDANTTFNEEETHPLESKIIKN